MATRQKETPRKRANGLAAREKILDAAAEIASERGYEGTSISLVSKRSGLPASSIYWHFEDKDDLIAAVIERSFATWLGALTDAGPPAEGAALEAAIIHQAKHASETLKKVPDFLRLGLMLALEKRPEEPTARKMFLKVRADALRNLKRSYKRLLPDLSPKAIDFLANYVMSMADGLFIARQIGDETTDLVDRYDLQAAAILGLIKHLRET